MAGESGIDVSVDFDTKNLRATLLRVKTDFGPTVHRNLRRNLRAVGDDIISDQRSELSKPSKGVARVVGKKVAKIKPGNGRKAYLRLVNDYEAVAASRQRSTNLRGRIKKALKTRVVAGKTRSGIRIAAAKTPSGSEENKYDMAKVWNKKVFRHRVFGEDGVWVAQYGGPYWGEPIRKGGESARKKAEKAIEDALNGKG